ncbi:MULTISPECIES: class I SAM-dependent methyltransferase [Lysinibacillus]|uniref:class I SAM-dependent methyltransferase n=1 Tax=Lysinibacillus TaxID=400634 RepID=UPI00082556EB|nr:MULTISPECIES: class I SAM-dependent methyltransferase [Lysinibacillus]MEC1305745.1 class I SAM-dependent methyltransferase [Lysinibacillus capsici]OCX65248.1 hypothetical protein BFM98_06540 [Lysinibacillus sp. AR18-8]
MRNHQINGECYLCKNKNLKLRHPRVRDNKDLSVLECMDCGLVFLESFSHISDEFYEESGMLDGKVNLSIYRKKSYKDDLRRCEDLRDKMIGKTILDFGCGAGGFLNLMKQYADKCVGIELDNTIRNSLNEEGIICFKSTKEIKDKFDFITLFHVVEHLTDPIETLKELREYLNPNGVIIIEVPNADDALLTLYNCEEFKDFTYWSCHTILYNSATLKLLLNKSGYSNITVKQFQRYPLSNHLYWLSQGMPGGHNIYSLLNNQLLEKNYEGVLASLGKCDTIIAEIMIN